MYHAALPLSPEDIYCAARMAFLEMALAGITAVGQFHYLHHAADGTPYEDRNLLAKQILRAAAGRHQDRSSEDGIRASGLAEGVGSRPGEVHHAKLADFVADTAALDAFLRKEAPAGHAWVGSAA